MIDIKILQCFLEINFHRVIVLSNIFLCMQDQNSVGTKTLFFFCILAKYYVYQDSCHSKKNKDLILSYQAFFKQQCGTIFTKFERTKTMVKFYHFHINKIVIKLFYLTISAIKKSFLKIKRKKWGNFCFVTK